MEKLCIMCTCKYIDRNTGRGRGVRGRSRGIHRGVRGRSSGRGATRQRQGTINGDKI